MQSNLGVAGPCFVAFAKLGTSALWKSGALAPRQSRKISEGFSPCGGESPQSELFPQPASSKWTLSVCAYFCGFWREGTHRSA